MAVILLITSAIMASHPMRCILLALDQAVSTQNISFSIPIRLIWTELMFPKSGACLAVIVVADRADHFLTSRRAING